MKQVMNLPLMAMLVIFLIVSQAAYCQDSTQKELKKDATEWYHNPVTNSYVVEFEPFSILLPGNQGEYTVYLVIPLDVELLDAYMKLSPQEGEIPTDVTIALGRESIGDLPDEFTGFKCSEELRDSMNKYIKKNQEKGEYKIPVPLVFTSQKRGTIVFTELSLEYKISAVEELESVSDVDTETPRYFFWKQGAGPGPTYELKILSERDFSDSVEVLLEKSGIVNAFYKLTDDEISKLVLNLKPGRTYYWGVRVVYDFGTSQWEIDEFTLRPNPVENLRAVDYENEIILSWDSADAEYFVIALNNHELELYWENNVYSIEKTEEKYSKHLFPYGRNSLTVWAVSGNKRSESREFDFYLKMDRLPAPAVLYPSLGERVEKKTFPFKWESVPKAGSYEIELFDSNGNSINLPTREGMQETIIVPSTIYDPWIFGNLELRSGGIYTWRVRALPRSEDTSMESEWTAQMFFYQPVLLWTFVLFSAIGGLLGGFIRITKEEQGRAKEKKRKLKIYLGLLKKSMDLPIAVIAGVIFYLLINQVLSPQLDPLGIPPSSYVGSLLLGFIGGLISYDLTRLRR